MEFLIGAVIIIILLLLLGVSWGAITYGIVILIGAVVSLLLIFFTAFTIRLLISEKKTGKFTRIGRPEKFKYDVAFYEIDGEEYPNIFPCEVNMFREKLYNPEKTVNLRLLRKKTAVFDKNAALTIIVGIIASVFLTAISVIIMIVLF